MGKRRRRVLVKPNRHALIEQHQRVVGRQILRNSSKPPAGQQNKQNSDGQVEPCVTLRRKTVLQKLSLFLQPLVTHSPIQPFFLRSKRIASVADWIVGRSRCAAHGCAVDSEVPSSLGLPAEGI